MKTLIAVAALAAFAARAEDKKLNDPQIATIALTAHQIDIDRGKLSLHSKNAEVKQFAEQMVNDHTAGKKEVLALASKLGVKPQASDVSKSLEADARKAAARLKKEKGAAFDKAYVDNEVAYHQQVLDAIDKVLIPNARNAELRDLITKVRPAIAAHLDHAKMIQSSLAKK